MAANFAKLPELLLVEGVVLTLAWRWCVLRLSSLSMPADAAPHAAPFPAALDRWGLTPASYRRA
jgi:hypothetical protein